MTLSAVLEILSVILVQCSSILQNSSVILKILSAILLNDYCGLAGRKAARGSVKRRTSGRQLGWGCAARSRAGVARLHVSMREGACGVGAG
jgi:hypothetical protein